MIKSAFIVIFSFFFLLLSSLPNIAQSAIEQLEKISGQSVDRTDFRSERDRSTQEDRRSKKEMKEAKKRKKKEKKAKRLIQKLCKKYKAKDHYSKLDDKKYLKNGRGEIVFIIEKDYHGFFLKKNNDPKILAHLNRNQFNKEAKGTLSRLSGDIYIDEVGCVWKKVSIIGSKYHNPSIFRKPKNVKFIRIEHGKKSSFETVREIMDGESIDSVQFRGKNVREGEYRGTYNFHDHSPTFGYVISWFALKLRDTDLNKKPFINYRSDETDDIIKHPHMILDEDLHNKGYKDYAVFDEKEGTPTYKEKMVILKIAFSDQSSRFHFTKKEIESNFFAEIQKIHKDAAKKQEYKDKIQTIIKKYSKKED